MNARVYDKKALVCETMRNAYKWAGLDSNQRKLTLMGLQPIPFSHSGTDPNADISYIVRC